jgi:hypothetical protein
MIPMAAAEASTTVVGEIFGHIVMQVTMRVTHAAIEGASDWVRRAKWHLYIDRDPETETTVDFHSRLVRKSLTRR